MRIKPVLCLLLGLTVGAAIAKFSPPRYAHGAVMLKENGEAKPIFVKPGYGQKTLGVTVKNLQEAAEVRLELEGGEIQSPLPPPIVLPFTKQWPALNGTTLSGLRKGMRVPLYIALDGERVNYSLSFVRVNDGQTILTVPIIEGEGCAAHGH